MRVSKTRVFTQAGDIPGYLSGHVHLVVPLIAAFQHIEAFINLLFVVVCQDLHGNT